MSRAASFLIMLFCSGVAACASGRISDSASNRPQQPLRPRADIPAWVPIALTNVPDPGLRRALTDLLMLVDVDVLWPKFTLADNPAIVVDSRDPQQPLAYCIGHCLPQDESTRGTSRLWLATITDSVLPGKARFEPLAEWGLRGDGKVVALGFQRREQVVTVVVHEQFHLHYQADYVRSFGDDIRGDAASASRLTRADLESSYSASQPVATELRRECSALVDALRAGNADRRRALEALRRFIAVRDARRARPGAPSFVEDFWEREEGVPVNLERRLARRMEFADPSLIGTALRDGCEIIPHAAYFLMLGGLQGAVLDELGDPHAWPWHVYPRDGTSGASLYLLIRELLTESERGDS